MRLSKVARGDRLSSRLLARLGVYEVIPSIGAGGMGEVCRARDTKLNRDVALQVLPDSFASDPDRLARFTLEAQTLAAINREAVARVSAPPELVALVQKIRSC